MGNLCIRLEDEDLEQLRAQAGEMRVPHTVLARMLIVQGMKGGRPQVQDFTRSH